MAVPPRPPVDADIQAEPVDPLRHRFVAGDAMLRQRRFDAPGGANLLALARDHRMRLALSAAEMGTWHWDAPTDQTTRDAGMNLMLGLDETAGLPVAGMWP